MAIVTVGRSAAARLLKEGAAASPLLGPAKTLLADAVAAPVPPLATPSVPAVNFEVFKLGISAAAKDDFVASDPKAVPPR